MRSSLICAVAIVAISCTGITWADDKKDADVEKGLSKIAQLGPGVHAIKKDNQGRITSCVVVGQSRISTVFGKAKGLEIARDRARLDVSGQLIRWLKEKVSVHVKTEDETIIFLEGSEENDKEALKESGKAVEKTSKKMESVADGFVRGLQILHVEVSDKDKTYTLVMGWDAKTAEATKGVKKINDSDSKKPESDPKDGGSKKPDESKKPIDKKIEDKKVTSDDAKKFLP